MKKGWNRVRRYKKVFDKQFQFDRHVTSKRDGLPWQLDLEERSLISDSLDM